MVESGKTRAVMHMVMDRIGGGPMQPRDIGSKLGKTVLEVPKKKYPKMMVSDLTDMEWLSFERYKEVTAEMFVDCNEEVVQEVAGKFSGQTGPSPVDGLTLGKWLLNCGTASHMLRKELALWTKLMCNDSS
jgi:hypothetical protein